MALLLSGADLSPSVRLPALRWAWGLLRLALVTPRRGHSQSSYFAPAPSFVALSPRSDQLCRRLAFLQGLQEPRDV